MDNLLDNIVTTVKKSEKPELEIVLSTPVNLSPEEVVRYEYIAEPLRDLKKDQPNFSLTEVGDSIQRVNGHPTLNGTKDLVDVVIDPTHIINKDVAYYARFYRGLQSMWKGGCKTCGRVGIFYNSDDKCQTCHTSLEQHKVKERWNRLYNTLFGPTVGMQEEREESRAKRVRRDSLEEEASDNQSKKPKNTNDEDQEMADDN